MLHTRYIYKITKEYEDGENISHLIALEKPIIICGKIVNVYNASAVEQKRSFIKVTTYITTVNVERVEDLYPFYYEMSVKEDTDLFFFDGVDRYSIRDKKKDYNIRIEEQPRHYKRIFNYDGIDMKKVEEQIGVEIEKCRDYKTRNVVKSKRFKKEVEEKVDASMSWFEAFILTYNAHYKEFCGTTNSKDFYLIDTETFKTLNKFYYEEFDISTYTYKVYPSLMGIKINGDCYSLDRGEILYFYYNIFYDRFYVAK